MAVEDEQASVSSSIGGDSSSMEGMSDIIGGISIIGSVVSRPEQATERLIYDVLDSMANNDDDDDDEGARSGIASSADSSFLDGLVAGATGSQIGEVSILIFDDDDDDVEAQPKKGSIHNNDVSSTSESSAASTENVSVDGKKSKK